MRKRSAAFYVMQAECDRLREEHWRELAAMQREEYLAQLQREFRKDFLEHVYGVRGENDERDW